MALVNSPDPVQATHQLMALLEYPELDAFERNLLEWHRESLTRTRAEPTPAGWLRWYRDALGAIRQLTARWQQAREATAPQNEALPFSANAVARLKDCHTAFIQRWNVRLQDQSTTLKARLVEDVAQLPVAETTSETHIQFAISQEVFAPFSAHVLQALNAWSSDVEAKLSPSWSAHVNEVLSIERLPPPVSRTPDWPAVRLGISITAPARLDPHAIRRPTIMNTFLRTVRSAQSVVTLLSVAAASTLVVVGKDGSSNEKALWGAVVGVVGVVVGLVAAITFGRRSIRDEIEQARTDEQHRLHAVIQTWIGTVVDGHRGRMQTLLASTASDARSKLVEWADESWKQPPAPYGARAANKQADYGPLLLSLNSIRGALATRAAQLELELGDAGRPAAAKPGA